jgi:hypothetical protein
VDIWIPALERSAINWNDAQTSAAAQSKLKAKRAFWAESHRRLNQGQVSWLPTVAIAAVVAVAANPPNVAAVAAVPAIRAGIGLRAALLSRFKLQVTELEAAEAVANLRQGPTKTVSEFLDRVAWSVETKNHTMTEDQKDNDQY